MVSGKLGSYMQKNQTGLSQSIKLSHTIYKINSKWINDLNIRSETIKFLENRDSMLFDISLSNIF